MQLITLSYIAVFFLPQCAAVSALLHRGLNETDCFPGFKKFKYEDTRISCNSVAANTTLCDLSWKASTKCEACGKCKPEVEETEDCFPGFKKFPFEDTRISCNNVAANTTLCDLSWKASTKCEACGSCTPEVEETEDCFDDAKKFKYEDTMISCNDVATNTTLCDASWWAGKKCEVCGSCTPGVEETEDCFPGFKKFPFEDTRISCNNVATNTTLCDLSWKASTKCEACGKCKPEVEEAEDCFDNAKKFKYEDTKISCNDVVSNTALCDISWKADKKCEICGSCKPKVVET